MELTQTSPTTPPPLFPSETQNNQDTPNVTLSSDFETFLRMLTVQMENQDPLNPIDSTDYAVQLATFSSVEQQVLTNDLLTALTATMSGGGLAALGQWVGMEVRGAPNASFSGGEIEISVPLIDSADRRLLVVADENGKDIARFDIDLTQPDQIWDGTLANGAPAPDGTYSFRVEGYKDGTLLETSPATTYASVTEARIEGSETVLVLANGTTMASANVTALREPRAPVTP